MKKKGGRLQTCGVKIVLDGEEMRYLVWPEVLVVLVVVLVWCGGGACVKIVLDKDEMRYLVWPEGELHQRGLAPEERRTSPPVSPHIRRKKS